MKSFLKHILKQKPSARARAASSTIGRGPVVLRSRLSRRARLIVGSVVGFNALVVVGALWWANQPPPPAEPVHYASVALDERVSAWRSGTSRVFAADDSSLAEVELEQCEPVGLTEMPLHLINAFRAAEEQGSCVNPGTLEPLMAAVLHDTARLVDAEGDFWHCEALRDVLVRDTTLRTPFPLPAGGETWLPLHDPDSLRAAWLNLIELGNHAFGVEAGAKTFFARSARELTPAQSAYLAARAVAPELRGSSKALKRMRDRILTRMLERGELTLPTLQSALKEEVPEKARRRDPRPLLPEYVRRAVVQVEQKLYGHPALRQGLDIHTPLDPGLQQVAAKAVSRVSGTWVRNRKKEAAAMTELLANAQVPEGEEGGPELPPGSWLQPPGDKDQPDYTLMAMEPLTGRVRVLFESCKQCEPWENGAFARKRQAGSSWKPFVYAEALRQGMNQVMSLPDKPFSYQVKGETWSPKNHQEKYAGQVTMRRALALSLNSVAIQLMFRVTPERVSQLARKMGVYSRLQAVPALALGTAPVTLSELVQAYSVFASGGYRTWPRFVDRVTDRSGRIIYAPRTDVTEPVLDPRVAYVMTDMLREVTAHGTAWPARKLPFQVAGKTGTTNESKDAWFVGYSSNLVAGVWVGFESKEPLGGHETGGTLALPVWMDVVSAAAKKEPPGDFAIPAGVTLEVRSPWGGHKHPEGREMAFIGTPQDPCYEVSPPFATPEKESDAARESRLKRLSSFRRGGSAGYRCPWRPLDELDGKAEEDTKPVKSSL